MSRHYFSLIASTTQRIPAEDQPAYLGVGDAAAAAWEDRAAQRRAGNRAIVERLHSENVLAAHWTVEEATDWLYALTSFGTWGYLTRDCGWSARRYERHLLHLLQTTLVEPGVRG